MSRRPRRRFSDVQKTKAVLSHVQDVVPVSQVCENLGIHLNKYNVLRDEIKLNKLEYKLTSQKLYSNQLQTAPVFWDN